jgi:hypothetical protein
MTIQLIAEGIAFNRSTFAVPANTPFDIASDNRDVGIPHNVSIYEGGAGGWPSSGGTSSTGLRPGRTTYRVYRPGTTYSSVTSIRS